MFDSYWRGLGALGLLALAGPAWSQCYEASLRKVEAYHGDYYGRSLAQDGRHIVVGAGYEDSDQVNSGAVYVHDAESLQLLYKLKEEVPSIWGGFGLSVSLQGDLLAVGAPAEYFDDQGPGAVYLYDVTSGELLRRWRRPIQGGPDGFGMDVALAFPYLVVRDSGEGTVYVFDVQGGALRYRVPNPHSAQTVLAAGDYLVTGTEVRSLADGVLRYLLPGEALELKDGRVLVGNWQRFRVLDVATGQLQFDLESEAKSSSFHGDLLALGLLGSEPRVELWDIPSGKRLAHVQAPDRDLDGSLHDDWGFGKTLFLYRDRLIVHQASILDRVHVYGLDCGFDWGPAGSR